jgi:hypothetical protein
MEDVKPKEKLRSKTAGRRKSKPDSFRCKRVTGASNGASNLLARIPLLAVKKQLECNVEFILEKSKERERRMRLVQDKTRENAEL